MNPSLSRQHNYHTRPESPLSTLPLGGSKSRFKNQSIPRQTRSNNYHEAISSDLSETEFMGKRAEEVRN
jgi:hypothetical protein